MEKWVGIEQVSVDKAVERLRGKIEGAGRTVEKLRKTGSVVWMTAKLALAGLVLYIIEGIAFYYVFGSALAFIAAFAITAAILLWVFVRQTKSKLGIVARPRDSFLIGRSYLHTTESRSADRRSMPVEVGMDGLRYLNYMHQPNHHILINGSTSSGKTVTMLTVAGRASIAGGVNFLMIDWNGENEEWAKSAGATIWKVPGNFKINLFKLNGMGKEARASMAVESLVVAARLTALQSTKVKSALLRFYNEGTEPSLFDMWNALCSKDAGKANVLNQRLRAIQRVIGYEPEEFWSGIFSRNNLVSLVGLNESEKSLVVYSLMQRISELFDRSPNLNSRLRLMVVMDEAWQFFRRERDFDLHRESSLEKVVRLGRKYGFGLVVSTQQLDDVPKVFINSCALIMLHQQREYEYFGRDVLGLGVFESAYLKAASQGEMLLFDRGMAQKGRLWPDYIKVSPLLREEYGLLASRYDTYAPSPILEPEMPIEAQDNRTRTSEARKRGGGGVFEGLDIPSVAVYRFMIAVDRTKNVTEAYAMLKERGWLTSLASLYGGKSKPSILARAASSGYVSQEAKLTEKGLDVINPERIIAKQGIYAGSEEHKGLMRKTIRMIQDNGNFAFTTSDKDSFDIGEIRARGKSVWDFEHLALYECQTSARKDSVEENMEKIKRFGIEPIWIAGSDEIANALKESTKCRCIVLR